MRQQLSSEEDKSYHQLIDQGKLYGEVLNRSPFYKPSCYIESENLRR